MPPIRKRSRKTTSKKKMAPLHTRLIAGKGALARLGKYWYPVRLIQSYGTASLPATARDRLGEWAHSWDTPREEDLIQNFMSAQASKELDDILRPHIASLQKLLDSPDLNQCGAEAYPVIDYILRSKKNLDGVGAYSIPFCGDVSTHEYAKTARWFSENIPGASGQVEKWLGGMPLVHAFTLVVAHRKAGDFSDELSEVVAPSLPAEEEIVPLKRRPSLPTEECAPVKRRRASQGVQRGKTRKFMAD
ncbi:hypothetical protein EV702DRAFT_1268704 [Suillus placidus]|uniref:Uncharacterized protein n=1 Tax=Suillus placidus TaxID=48579 RepID=A0A9P7D291_9AGAM|nr:hypothetical protein EV702DRAFT_1268704 [Suillus placidus]